MGIQAFAFIVFVLGLASLVLKPAWSLTFMMGLTVFGAAGTVILPGGASIPPASLFLIFVFARVLAIRGGLFAMLGAFRPSGRGAILLSLAVVGVLSAIFYPRILAGTTMVYGVDRSTKDLSVVLMQLRPVSGNVTQSVYLVGQVLAFAGTYALVRLGHGTQGFMRGLVIAAVVNIIMAFVDVATYAVGAGFLMDWVRSGGYAQLSEDAVGSMKRIVGAFPEASIFGAYSAPVFLAMLSLWWVQYRPVLTGLIAATTFVLIVLSTSTTGYVALGVLVAGVAGLIGVKALQGRLSRKGLLVMPLFALGIAGVGIMIATGTVPKSAIHVIEQTLTKKSDTDSAKERGEWNRRSLQSFADTYGLGVGLGSGRSSSFALVLLSNLGIPGTVLFCLFVGSLYVGRAPPGREERAAVLAARALIGATLISFSISGGVFDLGAVFYIACGVAAGLLEQDVRARARAPAAASYSYGVERHAGP